jgi:hypothetical protein
LRDPDRASDALVAIIRKLTNQTQQQTVWKSVENLVDLHAAEVVQSPVTIPQNYVAEARYFGIRVGEHLQTDRGTLGGWR